MSKKNWNEDFHPFGGPPGQSGNGPPKGPPSFLPANPPGQMPLAIDDVFIFSESEPAEGNLFSDNGSGPDNDPNGDEIVVAALVGMAPNPNQPITLSTDAGRSISITADQDGFVAFSGDLESMSLNEIDTLRFTYDIVDSKGFTDTANVEVVFTGENDAPTLSAGTLKATEDGAPVTIDLTSLADDADGDDDPSTLAYAIEEQPAEGSAFIENGILTFDPGTGFQDLDEGESQDVIVTVSATDRHGETTVNDVTVSVGGVNEEARLLTGFEGGFYLSGWDLAGRPTTVSPTATEGTSSLWLKKGQFQFADKAEVEELLGYDVPDAFEFGKAIKRDFYFEEGDIVSFDYRILNGETASFYLDPNSGLVELDGPATNDFRTESFDIPEDGFYTLGFGSDGMLLDNILVF